MNNIQFCIAVFFTGVALCGVAWLLHKREAIDAFAGDPDKALNRSAPPHDTAASEGVDWRWNRQGEIMNLVSAVEILKCQARKNKLFSVAQQLQTVIVVLDREYDLCRRSPDAFRLTETWEK